MTTRIANTKQPKGRVVVGVDCSEASKGPLLWAARQAELTQASLEVVLAWKLPLMAYGYTVPAPAGVDPESHGKLVLDSIIHSVLGEPDDLEIVPIVTGALSQKRCCVSPREQIF